MNSAASREEGRTNMAGGSSPNSVALDASGTHCTMLIRAVAFSVNNDSLKREGRNRGNNTNVCGSPQRMLKIAGAWCEENKLPDSQSSLLLSPADSSYGTPLSFCEALLDTARRHLGPPIGQVGFEILRHKQ